MIALCKSRPEAGAELREVPVPRPAKDELLVRVRRASICGSDMPIYNWDSWAPKRFPLPMVFGHEFCGEVASTGAATRDFKKGDFVSVESHIYCGLCYQCRNGQRHVCKNLKILGIDAPGGFAQYARVPARCAWKHSDSSLKDIGSVFEPLGNAVYATLAEEVVGKSVLVLGCGPQGLFALAVAKAGGAKPLVAVDASPFRRRLAQRMGADRVLEPGEGLEPSLRKLLGKDSTGFDAVLEMSGAAAAVKTGLTLLRSGGRMTAFGLPSAPLEVDWANDIVFKGIRIYGIAGREIFQTWYTMDAMLRSRTIDVRPVITHRFPLRDFKRAFSVMNSKEKKCGKVVLEIP